MAVTNIIPYRKLDRMARDLALLDTGKAERIRAVVERAAVAEVYPASIGPIYRALAAGAIPPLSVPAINLRGLTYDLARAIWRAAKDADAGPVIFELAPSESRTGRQGFEEFAALILVAALREGYRGPVFLQVDHFQIDRDDPQDSSEFRSWCSQSIAAGMQQVDFDASGLCAAAPAPSAQAACAQATAAAVTFHHSLTRTAGRSVRPRHDPVYGAEVGEIGGANTTVDDLREFMAAYRIAPAGTPPLGKISVNTGTTHGGLIDADGRPGPMPLDLPLLADLATVARREYGLPGVVQHAASTLSHGQLAQLPAAGVCEVHLATGIQNLVFDHPRFNADLRARMQEELLDTHDEAEGRELSGTEDWTPTQRFYSGRWTSWGQFKRELWDLPEEERAALRASLVDWCVPIFTALQIAGRAHLLAQLYGLDLKASHVSSQGQG
jgi:hypothetical protein